MQVITGLTKELLPYFVYLMDEIIRHENDFIQIGKIFKAVKEKETPASWHALRNAFWLREELKHPTPTGKNIHVCRKKALDALTCYYYGDGYVFRDTVTPDGLLKVATADVMDHYDKNMPNAAAVGRIFDHRYEKEQLVNYQMAVLEDVKDDVVRQKSLDEVVMKLSAEMEKRFQKFREKLDDDLKVRDSLIYQLQKEVAVLEKKSKRVSVLRSILGSFGAFFVTVNYSEDIVTHFFSDYLSWQSGLLDDDLWEDVL